MWVRRETERRGEEERGGGGEEVERKAEEKGRKKRGAPGKGRREREWERGRVRRGWGDGRSVDRQRGSDREGLREEKIGERARSKGKVWGEG